ncbi:MAG TPA: GNAT family N-acetyltransferase [Bryobacteraceae bacterium]|nr:GNAT family N-acetyltransferase [Bryobacteraceae bacterium]
MIIDVAPLQASDLREACRIFNVAFGTFLGVPDPSQTFGDRDMVSPRWKANPAGVLAARAEERLIGSNIVSRWGSFGFFGPLTVLPEFWDQRVGQKLLEPTIEILDGAGVRHSGLFTFSHSAKHVGLYQKFGYWPRYLTAIMVKTPQPGGAAPTLLSSAPGKEEAIRACGELTDSIYSGLDVSSEIRAVLDQKLGDIVLNYSGRLDAFAICHVGAGSEGGSGRCYVKFGAARGGPGAGQRFDKLLDACESFAALHGALIEAGVNLAREDAYRRMRARGFRTVTQGVAMQRPHEEGFNRAEVYAIDDWR